LVGGEGRCWEEQREAAFGGWGRESAIVFVEDFFENACFLGGEKAIA